MPGGARDVGCGVRTATDPRVSSAILSSWTAMHSRMSIIASLSASGVWDRGGGARVRGGGATRVTLVTSLVRDETTHLDVLRADQQTVVANRATPDCASRRELTDSRSFLTIGADRTRALMSAPECDVSV